MIVAAKHRDPYPDNQARFWDRALDALIDRAHALEVTGPATANRLWGRVTKDRSRARGRADQRC